MRVLVMTLLLGVAFVGLAPAAEAINACTIATGNCDAVVCVGNKCVLPIIYCYDFRECGPPR